MKNNTEVHGWVVAGEKELLKTSLATIKSGPAKCQRTGREKEFIKFDFSDWVNVVAVTPGGHLVMIRQFRYGSRRPEIEIPGGIIDPGEDPITAGCRELLEETGYRGGNPKIIGKVCPNPALQDNYCYTVMVEEAIQSDTPKPDDMEDIECFLRSYEEVTAMVRQGTIDHGLVLNALMFYAMTE